MSNPTSEPTSPPKVDTSRLRQEAILHYGITPGEQFNLLVVTCGLPRSGKTTWSKQQSDAVIVDPDCVRLAFQGRPYIKETEEWIWSMVRLMVRATFMAGHQNVIVQGLNLTPEHRRQWLANGLWFPVFCWFDTPADECLRRAVKNVRPDLEKVITILPRNMSFPEPVEGPTVYIK